MRLAAFAPPPGVAQCRIEVIANTVEYYVKVTEGLQIIRQRLVENGATV